jgi:membrane protein
MTISAIDRLPVHFPQRWWTIAQRVYSEFFEDSIPTVAGGVTFFFLLALFPAISSLVSLYGLIADRSAIARELDLISGFLPGGAVTVLRGELQRLAAAKPVGIGATFFAGLAIATWSASGGFKALVEALNVAYEVKETRSFARLSGNALLFTIAAILFAILALNLGLILPAWAMRSDAEPWVRLLVQILVWPATFLVCTILLALIYHFGPDRKRAHWRWITWGSAIASCLWLAGTMAFTWYAEHYGSYNHVYGELGAVVGFLTWVWLSIVILLLGAEIDCELERRDPRSPGAPTP